MKCILKGWPPSKDKIKSGQANTYQSLLFHSQIIPTSLNTPQVILAWQHYVTQYSSYKHDLHSKLSWLRIAQRKHGTRYSMAVLPETIMVEARQTSFE